MMYRVQCPDCHRIFEGAAKELSDPGDIHRGYLFLHRVTCPCCGSLIKSAQPDGETLNPDIIRCLDTSLDDLEIPKKQGLPNPASGMALDVELTLVTEDDKTIMSKIRDKMSVLNRILITESQDKTKIGYSLEFDSGISISAFKKFDFDKNITGQVQKIAQAARRKV